MTIVAQGGPPAAESLLESGPQPEAHQDDVTGRWYPRPETAEQYLSVTWVTEQCRSKPWLAPWASKFAAKYAVDFADRWQETKRLKGRDAAVKEITGTSAVLRELKKELGNYWHKVAEALLTDLPLPLVPQHLEGKVVDMDGEPVKITQQWVDKIGDGFLNFVADFGFRAVASECRVASPEHRAAGTIDTFGTLDGLGLHGLDLKTGGHLEREILAQLGAYENFTEVWRRNGMIVRRPPLDGWGILHLRGSYDRGYKLLTVSPEELAVGWAWWQQCRKQVEVAELAPTRFGRALYPPRPDGSQPPPMVEDLTSYAGCSRAVKPLKDNGFLTMADVALLDRADVMAIKGVGKVTVESLARVLADHGLAFKGERPVAVLAAEVLAAQTTAELDALWQEAKPRGWLDEPAPGEIRRSLGGLLETRWSELAKGVHA